MYKNARTKVSLNSLAESAASKNYRLALSKIVVRLGLPRLPEAPAKVLLFEISSRRQLVGAGISVETIARLPALVLHYPDALVAYREWCAIKRWPDETRRSRQTARKQSNPRTVIASNSIAPLRTVQPERSFKAQKQKDGKTAFAAAFAKAKARKGDRS